MKTETVSPASLVSICQELNLNTVKTYERKEGADAVKVIWIESVEVATEKLSEIVEKLKPNTIKCEWQRSYDEGGYAKISFNLAPKIDITGTVYFSNLLGDFEKTLVQNGYKKENYINVSWGMCDWVLPDKQKKD